MKLLSVSRDAKTIKGEKRGFLTGVLYLAPNTLSGKNLCPYASPGCISTCINSSGNGMFNSVQQSRIRKSKFFFDDRETFLNMLADDLRELSRMARKKGMKAMVRLNGTSDLPWETIKVNGVYSIHEAFSRIQFYDYTKNPFRMRKFVDGKIPENYTLVFSRSELNEHTAIDILKAGGNVSVVFSTPRTKELPTHWKGFKVVNGDLDDARPSDERGVVVGLRAKGKARKDRTGFVVQVS